MKKSLQHQLEKNEKSTEEQTFKKLTSITTGSSGYSQTARERVNWYKFVTSNSTSGNLS